MKKIVSALALGAVAASLATADVTVKINSRTRPSLYTSTETYSKDAAKTSTILDFSNADHNDDMTVTGSGENAGITAKIGLKNNKATYTNELEDVNNTGSTKSATTVSLGEYYGWFTVGNFKLTGGNFDSRLMDRYNKSAVEEGLTDGDTAKWGVSNNIIKESTGLKNTAIGKTFLYDFNNFVAIAGTRKVAMVGDYTLSDVGNGKLLLKAGIFANDYSYLSDDLADWAQGTSADKTVTYNGTDDKQKIGAGFSAEAAYQHEKFVFDLLFKKPTEHSMGIGAYFDLKAVENLNLALGLTYGTVAEYDTVDASKAKKDGSGSIAMETNGKITAMAFDARVFYKVNDPLLVGLQAKYSTYKQEAVAAGEDDLKGASLELVATAQYKVNDAIQTQFDIGYYNEDLNDDVSATVAGKKCGDFGETYLKLRPAVKFTANKAAAVTCALEYQMALNGSDAKDAGETGTSSITKSSIKIPVIMRIKL